MNILKKSLVAMLLMSVFTGIQAQEIIEVSTTTTPVTCGGDSDGSITITVSGGSGDLNYTLFKAGSFVEASGFIPDRTFTFQDYPKASNYFIIVSDGINALYVNPVIIGGPDPIQITDVTITDINCAGVNDGTITVTASGEDGNLIYDLFGPAPDQNSSGFFPNLPTGTYSVTVSHGTCSSTDDATNLFVDIPPPLTVALEFNTPVTCFGESDGTLGIVPSGGTPSGTGTGYTYSWTGPGGFTSTDEDLFNIPTGDYTVEVTDANGCTTIFGPVTVGTNTEILISLTGSTNVSCNGGNNGSANINVSGGVAGYTIEWVGQNTGHTRSGQNPIDLIADTYNITVTDAVSCSKLFTDVVTITEPDPISAAVVLLWRK